MVGRGACAGARDRIAPESRSNGSRHWTGVDAAGPEDESEARRLAEAFTLYLRAARADEHALSMLPPGRFLMPGDLEGSPALTFAPLDVAPGEEPAAGTLAAMMERRYEAYKTHVVKPFFRDHFARLDRQIVLVDMLAALNAGPAAIRDLETALADVLSAFRPGKASWLTSFLTRKIDRILFAATKADHVHHSDHDNLAKLLERLTRRAAERAAFSGATIRVAPLAAVRATREVQREARQRAAAGDRAACRCRASGWTAKSMTARRKSRCFPATCRTIRNRCSKSLNRQMSVGLPRRPLALRFLRFRPPRLEKTAEGRDALAAAYPARPDAAIPDRRQARMSVREERRRPERGPDRPPLRRGDRGRGARRARAGRGRRASGGRGDRASAASRHSLGQRLRSRPAARSRRSRSASRSIRWCAISSRAPNGSAGSRSR